MVLIAIVETAIGNWAADEDDGGAMTGHSDVAIKEAQWQRIVVSG